MRHSGCEILLDKIGFDRLHEFFEAQLCNTTYPFSEEEEEDQW